MMENKAEDWANKILDSGNFKEIDESSSKDLFEKGYCATHYNEDGTIENVTDNYVIGFDPYVSENASSSFAVYKNGKLQNTDKLV